MMLGKVKKNYKKCIKGLENNVNNERFKSSELFNLKRI